MRCCAGELERISCTDVGGDDGKNRLEKAVNEITLTYQYDRGGAIRNVMDRMGDVQPETDNVPFVIEAVDVQPLVSGKVSIMDDSPVKDRKLQAANLYENVSKREKKAGQRSSHKPDITEKKSWLILKNIILKTIGLIVYRNGSRHADVMITRGFLS